MSEEKLFLSQKPTVDELVRFLPANDVASLLLASSRFSKHVSDELVARRLGYNWSLACHRGLLNVVKWMHTNNVPGCTHAVMDVAAKAGHLDIVRWLHENRSEGCTTNAMTWAAGNGHLDVVQWLHENRKEGCNEYAMEFAANQGHLHVLQWIHANIPTAVCGAIAMAYAIHAKRDDIVEWLLENRTFSQDSMMGAIEWATHRRYHNTVQQMKKLVKK